MRLSVSVCVCERGRERESIFAYRLGVYSKPSTKPARDHGLSGSDVSPVQDRAFD